MIYLRFLDDIYIYNIYSLHSLVSKFGLSPPVELNSRLTARWALLLLLCAARQVFHMTEQPVSSVMMYFPYMRYVIDAMKRFKMEWSDTFTFLG